MYFQGRYEDVEDALLAAGLIEDWALLVRVGRERYARMYMTHPRVAAPDPSAVAVALTYARLRLSPAAWMVLVLRGLACDRPDGGQQRWI